MSEARVLVIGKEPSSVRAGGLNRYVDDLVQALRRSGHEVAVVVADPGRPLIARVRAGRRDAATTPLIDVVDAHFALYAVLPLLTTRLRRRPLVVHFHGPWAQESRVAGERSGLALRLKRAVEKAVLARADAVVVLSAAFASIVVDDYGTDPSRVTVMAPGVDLERFRPGDRSAARAALGLDADAFVVVAARRLDARMGLDVLLSAWPGVTAVRPDAALLVAGEGRERERLEAQRLQLPAPASVRFLGRVTDDELTRLYRAADCSVVPSRALEGFGLVTLESMACGTPPVVTDAGGLPDGVVGLDPSLVVPAGDAHALTDRLVAAAGGALPSRAACRAHAERFSWDSVARAHVELYDAVRQGRPHRVVYVGHTAALSGGELALARVLPGLPGVAAHVILGEDGPLVGRLRAAGATVEVLALPARSGGLRKADVSLARFPLLAAVSSARYSLRLARRLRRLRPDLVHTNTLKAALYGGVAGRLARVPVVWHVRDRLAPDYLSPSAIRLVRLASSVLPTAIIANSEATRRTLGRAAARALVVPSPAAASAPARPSADGPARPFTVGLVGRLARWKGQDVFLRAFAAAFPAGDARARIVGSAMFGEDEWAASLTDLVRALGIADRVDFVGFVDDVAGELARMDVAVHASTIPEPFGQVVVESMAAGVPVVAADAGGPAEVVTDGIDGLLYPMGDVGALAERLRRLAADAGLRCRLAAAGSMRAGDFTAEKVGASLLSVYHDVMAGAGSRGSASRGRVRS